MATQQLGGLAAAGVAKTSMSEQRTMSFVVDISDLPSCAFATRIYYHDGVVALHR